MAAGVAAAAAAASSDEADRISTASVMEERIRQVHLELQQLELEFGLGLGGPSAGGPGWGSAEESYYGSFAGAR